MPPEFTTLCFLPLCTSFTPPTGLFHAFSCVWVPVWNYTLPPPTPFLRSGSQYHSLPPIFRVRTIVFPGFFPYFLFSCSMNPMRPYDAGSEPRGFRMKFRHEAPPEWTLNHASMCGLMCCLQRRSNPLFFKRKRDYLFLAVGSQSWHWILAPKKARRRKGWSNFLPGMRTR